MNWKLKSPFLWKVSERCYIVSFTQGFDLDRPWNVGTFGILKLPLSSDSSCSVF